MTGLRSYLAGALDDQALRWPLLLPLALSAGAALYMTAPDEPSWLLLGAVTAPPLLVWLLLRRHGGRMVLLFALLACTGAGAISGKARTQMVAAPVLRTEIGPVRIEGAFA